MRYDLLEKITKSDGRLQGLRCVVVRHPQAVDAWTLAVPVRNMPSAREYVGVWWSREAAEHERRLVRAACFQQLVAGLARRANTWRARGWRERATRCTTAMMRCMRHANLETYAAAGRRAA